MINTRLRIKQKSKDHIQHIHPKNQPSTPDKLVWISYERYRAIYQVLVKLYSYLNSVTKGVLPTLLAIDPVFLCDLTMYTTVPNKLLYAFNSMLQTTQIDVAKAKTKLHNITTKPKTPVTSIVDSKHANELLDIVTAKMQEVTYIKKIYENNAKANYTQCNDSQDFVQKISNVLSNDNMPTTLYISKQKTQTINSKYTCVQ